MLKSLTLGQYISGSSFIHSLDPRTKFLSLIPIVISVSINLNFDILLYQYIFLVVIISCSGIDTSVYLKNLRFFALLFMLTFVLHAFLSDGKPIVDIPIPGISLTQEGIRSGLFFSLRLVLVVAFSLIFMFTTSPTDIVSGIEKILRPLKKVGIQTDKFALLLGITIRFIPVIFEEAEKIKKAQQARGAKFKGSIAIRIKSLSSIIIPLFMSVFRRADTLAMALEVRGYPGVNNKTYFRDMKMGIKDKLILVSVSILSIASIGL